MAPPQWLSKRACSDFDGPYCNDDYSWWWSSDGYGVRYAIIALIFIAIALLLFGAYFHAQRRIRKGLPPLAYHRWLISRRRRATPYPQQNNYAYYQQHDPAYPPQQGYPMQNMGNHGNAEFQPPPPAYGNWEAPPVYQPPQGASKVAANQNALPVVRSEGAGEGSSASLPLNNNSNNNQHTQ
ncbi:hypothetical protein KCU62_g7365, partial [Aureobasidium sp. EXF-3399]